MNTSLFSELNDRQRDAVTAVNGPVLVIAGAGSGKTRVLTERIAYLLREHHVSPREILAFTFTNKAAREMKERLERKTPGAAETMWVGTFHATGVRILRRHGDKIGIQRNFSIYDADDSLNLLKRILQRNAVAAYAVRSPRALRDKISRMKNGLVTPAIAQQQAAHDVDERIATLYAEYVKELERANALDFDDLIARVVELFSVCDEARVQYATRFRYVLVDEFQDTNAIQMAMIDHLSSVHHNLFVVGDDDQSIYSWRGARVEHILDFEDLYENTRVIRLEQNYRSTRTILNAANHVIAHNEGRKGKHLWTDGDVGEKIQLIAAHDEESEAVYVVQCVKRMCARGLSLKDIAILYRTNAQSRALEDVLVMSSLPYQIIGSVRFYERMEVRDILAWCKVLVNPNDTVNLRRAIHVPRRGIGKTSFEKLEEEAYQRGVSVIDVLRDGGAPVAGAPARRCAEFLKLYERLATVVANEVAPVVVERVVELTGYVKYLETNYPDGEGRVENVEEIISKASGFAEGADDPSLRGFLEEVALVADVDNLDLETGQLTLMTLHNAKGLEFDCVVVTGLEEGLFPHFNSFNDQRAIEEERRLFYVGITRARKHLVLTCAGMRRRQGQFEGGMPSRFLGELPDECLDRPQQPSVEVGVSGSRDLFGGAGTRVMRGTHDEYSQESPGDDQFSQEELSYRVGMRVRHDNFGAGVVRKVEGAGDQLRITVIFDLGSERKFLAQYAPMHPM